MSLVCKSTSIWPIVYLWSNEGVSGPKWSRATQCPKAFTEAAERCGWVGSFLVCGFLFNRAAGHIEHTSRFALVTGFKLLIWGASKQCS